MSSPVGLSDKLLEPRKTPPDPFNSLFDQCNNILSEQSMSPLPYRGQIIHFHSIRNDAQHKAKYPNEIDVSDYRAYARDFCREVIFDIWGVVFDALSSLDWVDDVILRELLEVSLADIQTNNFKKGLTLIGAAFSWASRCILDFLPQGADGLYHDQVPELGTKTIEYVNSVLKDLENTAIHYAALISTGINPADYKRFREATPFIHFSYKHANQTPNVVDLKISAIWHNKNPDYDKALWAHEFAVNSIINWQALGLSPAVDQSDQKTQAEILIAWETDEVFMH